MDDPTELPSIKSWVDEWGGGVDYVDFVKFNGDLAVLAAFSRILWPRFVEVEGCVLWDRVYEESNFRLWYENLAGEIPRIEATLNQVRVWQIAESGDEGQGALEFIAACIADSWRASLSASFPERNFDVRVAETEDGPIVTFSSVAS
ncbi:hypothetical protein [Streptomyces sp. enrichment culture]|uniref:hypothetical protein n=1 Tax=Streptomyces sp. enrichment culture TaxID=1795815 RepID=UPI003F550220